MPGTYRRMNQGLDANIVFIDNLDDELEELGGADRCDLAKINVFELSDSRALAGSMDKEPTSLRIVARGHQQIAIRLSTPLSKI